MNNENQFKNKIKELVQEKQFRYEPSNWEQISNVLDKQARKRKLIYFTIIFGVLVSVGSILFITAENKAHKTLQSSKEVQSNQYKNEKVARISTNNAEKKFISKQIQTTTNKIFSYQKNSSSSLTSIEKNKQNTIHSTSVASISKEPLVTIPEYLSTQNNSENAENKSTNHSYINIKSDSAEKIISEDKSLNTMQTPSFINMGSKIENNLAPSVLQNQVYQSNISNTLANQTQNENSDSTIKLNRLNNYLTFKDTSATNLSLQSQKVDSLNNLIIKDEPIQKIQNGFFIIEVGSFFNAGWKYNAKQEAFGFNLYSGLAYSRKLTPKINFIIGTYYAPVSHLKASKKIITNYDFVFGERIEITEIRPLTLNYIQVPLSLHYHLTSNHALSFGCAFNYLLDVRSRVDSYTEELHTQFDKRSSKTFGYTDGFAKLSSSITFGYRFKLSKNIWINNQFLFGLTELRKDDFLKNEQKEKSRGIVVSLNYYFINK